MLHIYYDILYNKYAIYHAYCYIMLYFNEYLPPCHTHIPYISYI